jgi:superfamily II DNA or RNA helicase
MSKRLNTIIDNQTDNTLLESLKRLLPDSTAIDITTGVFEIGSLLALDGFWNHLDKMRIIMGDETTRRTRKELVEVIRKISDESIEREKERDDSLTGLTAIRQALEQRIIDARIYRRAKFHAKSYLMKAKSSSPVDFGVIGSSNFTEPGLTRNVELNLFTTDQLQLDALRKWFEVYWKEAEDVREEIIEVINPHLKQYLPFEVYVKALYEYFLGKEMPATSWEEQESVIYPILDDLQKNGYRQALWIAEQWDGALICDGVGFGKTYIGLMLIERFLHERKRILLLIPKSTRESVWKNRIRKYLPDYFGEAFSGDQIEILNHTDLHREILQQKIESIQKRADVVIVDEGHHFRTKAAQRSKKLYDLLEYDSKKKKIFFLTATPVNNSLFDLLHLMEYFTRDDRAYFRKLGINDTRSYFVRKEKAVEAKMGIKSETDPEDSLFPDLNISEIDKVLRDDTLFRALVIQRSRDYARRYFEQSGNGQFYFPDREQPKVAKYTLAKVYRELFPKIKESFNRENPFLELTLYNTESKRKGDIDTKIENREKQVLMLIRSTLLKRMESSYKAFEASCEDMLRNMARFLRYHDERQWNGWKHKNETFWSIVEQHWIERFTDQDEYNDVEEDDILPEPKQKLDENELFIDEIIQSVSRDMDSLVEFLSFIHSRISDKNDDKLHELIKLLNSDKELRSNKVIIFTQYRDTARYLYRNLKNSIEGPIEQLDSTSTKNRDEIIKRFSPYYNCNDNEVAGYLSKPIRVLISTDILSEGLNLQDAHLLINYDLHWNPVRLMQRIGRVDRRLDPSIEKKFGRDKCIVRYWNFLPPDELDSLLNLYSRVTGKLIRISKTLGIEGKQVLTPEDDYEALRDFNATYNGIMTFEEKMNLVLKEILKKHPALEKDIPLLPKRLFSGKRAASFQPSGVFAAYRLPSRIVKDEQNIQKTVPGECKWYFHRFKDNVILEDTEAIHGIIQSEETTPRIVEKASDTLRKSLKKIERDYVQKELMKMQALAGEKATLMCWMEVC